MTPRTNPSRIRFAAVAVALAMAASACGSGVSDSLPSWLHDEENIEAPIPDPAGESNPALETEGAVRTDAAEDPTPASTPARTSDDEATDGDDSTGEVVDEYLDGLGERGFVGAVMVRGPEGDWSAEFGKADRAADVNNRVDTIFDIGSITKQFTGAAILRLEMDGKVSVDDAIGMYVDGLTDEQADITLHQLLTHTAGLPDALGPDEEVITLDDYVERLAATPMLTAPGTQYEYSNTGYSLLAAAIERVTGDSYEQYLHDALFVPAGMFDTGYVLPDWTGKTIAVGYDGDEKFGRPNEEPWDVDGPWWHLRGNGGILSSMPDMLLWDTALQGGEILDAAAKTKMFTPHTPEGDGADTFYGYGWVVMPLEDGSTLITHNGGNGIFFADFLRFVDTDVTIVLATNAADPAIEDVAYELAGEMFGTDLLGADAVCGLESISFEAAADFELIADFPDTSAGVTIEAWIEILRGEGDAADQAAVRAFTERYVADVFLDDLGVDGVTEVVGSLQEEFAGFSIDRIHQEDERTFHVVLVDEAGLDQLAAARVSEEPEPRLECVGFSS